MVRREGGIRSYRRGSVVWANLDPVEGHEQAGHRPVLIASDERFNDKLGVAFVVPLTSRDKWLSPLQVALGEVAGKPAFALPGQARSVSTVRLGRELGVVGDDAVEKCLGALLQICGCRPSGFGRANDG